MKYAKLNAYADDHQIYSSSRDPFALEECNCQEVNVANQWYKNNDLIVDEKKHQALILGKTEHNFSFPVNKSIDIFGMTVDNRFSFDNHVSVICKNRMAFCMRMRCWCGGNVQGICPSIILALLASVFFAIFHMEASENTQEFFSIAFL